mgnify:CR=1 FL=1
MVLVERPILFEFLGLMIKMSLKDSFVYLRFKGEIVVELMDGNVLFWSVSTKLFELSSHTN